MRQLSLILLLSLLAVFNIACSTVTNSKNSSNISIVKATPTNYKQSGYWVDDCCDNCLCHGTDLYFLKLENIKTFYGESNLRNQYVSIFSGAMNFNHDENTKPTEHLFILNSEDNTDLREKGILRFVIDADPLKNNKFCLNYPLEEYLKFTTTGLDYQTWTTHATHCYTINELKKILVIT